MSRIALGQMLVLKLPQELIADSHLSVPAWDILNGTNGYCRDSIRAKRNPHAPKDAAGNFKLPYRSYDEILCALPYEVHLRVLKLNSDDPWLLLGARNLGNNFRIIGYKDGKGLLQLNGENADNNNLDYCCLCMTKKGNLLIEELKFTGGKPSLSDVLRWAVSGQQLVWDGKPADIEKKIIPYTYDLRHVWRTKGWPVIEQAPTWMPPMADCFVANANKLKPEDLTKTFNSLINASGFQLERERHYLHSAIGISEKGETIIIVQRHGAFEDVAKTLIDAGAYRAIELDQGGSCSVMMGGTKEFSQGRTIFASHYFRPRGLALLVFEFKKLEIADNSNHLASRALTGDSVNNYTGLLEKALEPLSKDEKEELLPILRPLFEIIFPDLQRAKIGNPIEHHLIVLSNMMEIAKAENFSLIEIKRVAALSLLHDISAVEKITTQQVDELRKKNPEQADALELQRKENRILHMREGSAMAHRRMLEFNESLGRVVFDSQDIEQVCEIIGIHDNPSLDIPIPRQNWLAVAFREADRLWMITHEGIQVDLERKGKDPTNPQYCLKQLESNIAAFKKERRLYDEATEGPFCDDETFFRTKKGREIYQRLHKEGIERYGKWES